MQELEDLEMESFDVEELDDYGGEACSSLSSSDNAEEDVDQCT